METNRGAEKLHIAMKTHLSLGEVIGQVVQKFIKDFKPWEIAVIKKILKIVFVIVLKLNLLRLLSRTNVPEYAEAGMCAVGETTEAKPLASLKVSQNKSKVLHGHSVPHSVQVS